MTTTYRKRIARVRTLLKGAREPAALLVSSAESSLLSRDTAFPYRPASDLYYLTGSTNSGLELLITSTNAHPVLFARPADSFKVLWEGPQEAPGRIAKRIGAELKICPSPVKEILPALKGVETLYHGGDRGTSAFKAAQAIFEMPGHQRLNLPRTLSHSDLILEQLRLFKEPGEVRSIRNANKVTSDALLAVYPNIRPGISEAAVAGLLDSAFLSFGAERPAFNTIVASGPNAAILHYEKRSRVLRRGEMLLLDCGAQAEMYCSDITRVVPVGTPFKPWQRELYQIVLSAQKAALKTVRHGVPVKRVYDAAAREITAGLKEIGVLSGDLRKLIKREACKRFFPHGIGHSLGLDVHDSGKLRGSDHAVLRTGMVVTIEPGIYFAKKTKHIPSCGIRIEDNVLVTKAGCQVLSDGFPKELEEIEALSSRIPKQLSTVLSDKP